MRKPAIWVPTRSDTNRPVQAQEMARRLKKKRDSTVHVAKTKALISFAVTAKLVCAFVFLHMQIVGFLMRELIFLYY